MKSDVLKNYVLLWMFWVSEPYGSQGIYRWGSQTAYANSSPITLI